MAFRAITPVIPGKSATFSGKIMVENVITPRQAGTLLGVSYVTVKQWILKGSLKTVKTPGGHHRIPMSAIEALRGAISAETKKGGRATAGDLKPVVKPTGQVSGRNQLAGIVTEVTVEGLLARVRLRIGEQQITSIITSEAVRAMKLKKGDRAAALIKATEVMIQLI